MHKGFGQAWMSVGSSESESRYDRRPVGQSVLVSSAPSDERSDLSFVLVTWTSSVQFSKFAAGTRQLFILTRRRATVIQSLADSLTDKSESRYDRRSVGQSVLVSRY
jgi:hypothetical protein